MAFPTIPTVAAGRVLTTNQADASGTRTFPSLSSLTKNSGDTLIAIAICYQSGGSSGAVFSSWGASFTELTAGGDQMTTSGSTMCIGIASKISTGSETGTFTVTQASPTGRATLILLSIPGGHESTAPEAGTIANGTSGAADPGSFNPAGWGTEDTLWIAVAASGMTSGTGSWTATGTAAPANYGDRVDSNTTDNSTVGQTEGAVAFRQLNAASEDIGTAGVDTSNARNSALVIAVRPAPLVHSGSGGITVPSATVSGTGVMHPSGTGAISVPTATVAGTGTEVFTATGAVSVPSATVAGTGAEVFTATGAVSVPPPTVEGTGAEVFTATGAVSVPPPSVDGTGDHTESEVSPEGSGAITIPSATIAGTGELILTGSGAVSVPAPSVSGTGAEVFTGTGAISVPPPSVVGDGLLIVNVTGTGAIVIPAPLVSGSGIGGEDDQSGGGRRRHNRPPPAPEPVIDEDWLVLIL